MKSEWLNYLFLAFFIAVISACSNVQSKEPVKSPAMATSNSHLVAHDAQKAPSKEKNRQSGQTKKAELEDVDHDKTVDCFYAINMNDPLCTAAK